MSKSLKALLVGGPMYDPLYTRLAEFEEREGLEVETVIAPTHPGAGAHRRRALQSPAQP